MTEYGQLRARHMARAVELAPGLIEALDWDAGTLAAHREERLRALLRTAVERSPWHRARLAGLDVDAFTLADLAALPVMTKADLMADWDDVVTDRRITLAGAEAYLAQCATGGYLEGTHTVLATGGSTGRRAVLVYDWEGWAVFWNTVFRQIVKAKEADPRLATRPMVIGWVMAAHFSHASAALARTFDDPRFVNVRCPVTWALEDIVAGLNAARPDLVVAYPSLLHTLAEEATAGRLTIAPTSILVAAEPLLPETRAAAEAAWGVPVANLYGASETGGIAAPCALGGAHLEEDTLIVEPVDSEGRPVAPGQRSAKVYVTNLFNHTLPLIRYEITDEITVLPDPCPCGAATACVADIEGRLDDTFAYGAVRVHPHVFRSAFTRRATIAAYQVAQTDAGADICVCSPELVDAASLAAEIAAGMRGSGLVDPQVTVRQVEAVERLPGTGKLKRFVPLALSPAALL